MDFIPNFVKILDSKSDSRLKLMLESNYPKVKIGFEQTQNRIKLYFKPHKF